MRELVRGMCSDWTVSIRTACGAIAFDRSTFHYQSRRSDLAAIAKEICETRVGMATAAFMSFWIAKAGLR